MTSCLIVGYGKVGRTLHTILTHLGCHQVAFLTKPTSPAQFLEKSPDIQPLITTWPVDIPKPDLVLITTPDNLIAEIAHSLAAKQHDWTGTIVLHCSGVFGSDILNVLKGQGASTGSLHPLKSFVQPSSLLDLKGVYWTIEGDPAAQAFATKIVTTTEGKAVIIATEHKALYHAAAVMACGHLTALLDISLTMLQTAGIEKSQSLEMLKPLVMGTIENIMQKGTVAALTGPFARGDHQTIAKHQQALADLNADYLTIYNLLGNHSLEILKRRETEPTNSAR